MIQEISHELVFSIWKVAYCTRPHEWSRILLCMVQCATNVNRISNGADTKMDTSICIDFQYLVRPAAWARMDESGRISRAGSKARSRYAQRPSSNPDAVR
jgi:hypothetical protein